MANKITQLVNKDGDNLYPLAGGILSDSVTTDMIQDDAVTSDKIDWTTIGDTLWTNPDPTQAFAAQTVSFDGSSYDYFMVEFLRITGNATQQFSSKMYCPDNTATNINSIQTLVGSTASNAAIRYRTFTMTNSSCQFAGAFECVLNSGGSTAITANNTYFIPTKILGYKG